METLIVLVITGLLLGFVAGAVEHQNGLVRAQAQQAAFGDAMRVTDVVLQGELRWADPGHDLGAVEPESVQVRAARAFGVVCGWRGTVTLARLRGIRRPDRDKDSVLLVPGPGVLALRGAVEEPTACPHGPDEQVYGLELDTPAPRGALLIFERGSYHLAENAFRYRRGQAGRQPLTAEVLSRGRFTPVFAESAVKALDVRVAPRPGVHGDAAGFRVVFANSSPALKPDTAVGP